MIEITTMNGLQETNTEIRIVEPIMQYFHYDHLPEKLQKVSKPFCLLAQEMDNCMEHSAEKSAGLRKLLEAKDCFCRAAL